MFRARNFYSAGIASVRPKKVADFDDIVREKVNIHKLPKFSRERKNQSAAMTSTQRFCIGFYFLAHPLLRKFTLIH
jgi:hypothetical protein